jgi:ribosome-binding factor A
MNQAAASSGGRPPGTPRTRALKLGDRIAQIVAEMLERRIKDPRLGFVTVTEARVTGDLREATVYYTVYGSPDEVAGTAAALASATGLIRSEVGRQTGIKHTPSITFVEDKVPDNARAIEDLVARARQADAEVAAARAEAVHAGDADPYRQPASRDDDDFAGNDLLDDQFDDDLDDDDAPTGPLGNYPGGPRSGGRSARP